MIKYNNNFSLPLVKTFSMYPYEVIARQNDVVIIFGTTPNGVYEIINEKHYFVKLSPIPSSYRHERVR